MIDFKHLFHFLFCWCDLKPFNTPNCCIFFSARVRRQMVMDACALHLLLNDWQPARNFEHVQLFLFPSWLRSHEGGWSWLCICATSLNMKFPLPSSEKFFYYGFNRSCLLNASLNLSLLQSISFLFLFCDFGRFFSWKQWMQRYL